MIEINPHAVWYYDQMDLDRALAVARQRIADWDYESDPKGYCYIRPVLLELVRAVEGKSEPSVRR